MARRLARILAIVAVNVVLAILLAEGAARLFHLDRRMLLPILYFQVAEPDLHESVTDPTRLYDLAPGTSGRFMNSYGWRSSRINALGLRGPEGEARKQPGVYRIVVFGASNAYGAFVSDDETFPAQAERLLNERGDSCRYEVWNAGVSAYLPSQEVGKARALLAKADADLLVFQTYMFGRRAFRGIAGNRPWAELDGGQMDALLAADPGLWWENVPFVPLAGSRFGRALFDSSALWRSIVTKLNHHRRQPNHRRWEAHDSWPALDAFLRDMGSRIPTVFCGMIPWLSKDPRSLVTTAPDPSVAPPSDDPIFREIHPPAHVYGWYATVLEKELTRLGYLPCGGAGPGTPP